MTIRNRSTALITCRECVAWETGELRQRGYCRRYAPKPESGHSTAKWPKTNYDDGCAEGIFNGNPPALPVNANEDEEIPF